MGVIALPELPWRKILGASAVAVLHIAIVVVLLNATMVHRMFKPEPHETILFLRPLPKPQAKPKVEPSAKACRAPARSGRSSYAKPRQRGLAETEQRNSDCGYTPCI